jgi:hypothetical protein
MTTSSRTALAEVTKNAHISAMAVARCTALLSGINFLPARNGAKIGKHNRRLATGSVDPDHYDKHFAFP